VTGVETIVDLHAFDNSTTEDNIGLGNNLVLRAVDRSSSDLLGSGIRHVQRIEESGVSAAYLSPDGSAMTFALANKPGVMCWSFASLDVVTVKISRHRASFANTRALAAWKKGQGDVALAGFVEATTIDPTFHWGWYNRASVEAKQGNHASAKTSLDVPAKLDPKARARACTDLDFASLRAAEPNALGCAKAKDR